MTDPVSPSASRQVGNELYNFLFIQRVNSYLCVLPQGKTGSSSAVFTECPRNITACRGRTSRHPINTTQQSRQENKSPYTWYEMSWNLLCLCRSVWNLVLIILYDFSTHTHIPTQLPIYSLEGCSCARIIAPAVEGNREVFEKRSFNTEIVPWKRGDNSWNILPFIECEWFMRMKY